MHTIWSPTLILCHYQYYLLEVSSINLIHLYLMTGDVTLRLAGKWGISTTSGGEPLEPRRPPAPLSFGLCVSAIRFMRNLVVEFQVQCKKRSPWIVFWDWDRIWLVRGLEKVIPEFWKSATQHDICIATCPRYCYKLRGRRSHGCVREQLCSAVYLSAALCACVRA